MGLAIGDPTFGNGAALTDVVATTYLKNHSLGIPKDIISLFEKADDRCGFTKVLDQVTYPPKGKISIPGNPEGENFKRVKRQIEGDNRCTPNPDTPTLVNHSINACNAAIENNACATFATGQNYLGVARPWYVSPIAQSPDTFSTCFTASAATTLTMTAPPTRTSPHT